MATVDELPPIIQGGMGMQISSWQLASAVARSGQLGVVSGTALDLALARRLQDGDLDGHYRRALAHFPDQAIVERVVTRYFVPGGRAETTPYRPVPRLVIHRPGAVGRARRARAPSPRCGWPRTATTASSGSTCWRRSRWPSPRITFGAMLAGVDVGARRAPASRGSCPACSTGSLPGARWSTLVDVHGADEPTEAVAFDPVALLGRGAAAAAPARLPRHRLLPRAGDLPRARRVDPSRRIRGRGVSGRRAQRPAAATRARRGRERPLRPARRAGRREDRRAGPAVLARGGLRHPGGPRRRPGGRGTRHPGRHRLRPRRGVGDARRPAARGPRVCWATTR